VVDSLEDRWVTKERWLRALFVRVNIIWMFRGELARLALGQSTFLDPILVDAYNAADTQAIKYADYDEAFAAVVAIVADNIDQRIRLNGDTPELMRLRQCAEEAAICDLVQIIFDELAVRTRRIHRGLRPRKTYLHREWLSDHPEKEIQPGVFPDPYHIGAGTITKGRRADIELDVHLENFDVPSLMAIPALLTHELVSHAHAGEVGSDSMSMWAEGVMDWTSKFFFDEWAAWLGLPYEVIFQHGCSFREARMTTSRHTGRFAAETLVGWLAREPEVGSTLAARSAVAQLTLQLNAYEAPLLDKDSLASRFANLRDEPDLQDLLRAWWQRSSPAEAMLA
jgi:hypothetical protein